MPNQIFNVPSNVQQVIAAQQAPGSGPNPVARTGAPIALTSELTTIVAGNGAVFPSDGLQPSFRTPYWIDEVRITITASVTAGTTRLIALPAALRLWFSTGKYACSKVGIPAMLFSQIVGADEWTTTPADFNSAVYQAWNFRWLLPKPMYMPIGDILQCRVDRDVTLAASGVTLRNAVLTYMGRACAPGEQPPPCRYIPWVGYYKHPYTSLYSATADEFRNPFMKDLIVQRLINRTVDYKDDATDATKTSLLSTVNAGASQPGRYSLPTASNEPYLNVKIQDSAGYTVVPDFTPVGAVIDPERAVWTYNRALSAREQLAIAFQTVLPTAQALYFDSFVSMVGYREEAP